MNSKELVTECGQPANTELALDIIKSLLLRKGDVLGLNYMKYRAVIRDVYMDLNLHTIRYTQRYRIAIDKNTMTVDLPDKFLMLSSVAVEDNCGKLHYLSYNPNITHDILDISLADSCGCECGCTCDICKGIRSYEPIIEVTQELMPDGSTKDFENVTRKRLDSNGNMVVEKTFPVRMYTAGVWTDTVLQSDTQVLCNLETLDCGCIKDTPANLTKVMDCCNAVTLMDECGCCRPTAELEYGVSELGNRLKFPSNFLWDKVVVRFYVDAPIGELRIPRIARKAFMLGIQDELELDEHDTNQYKIEKIEQRYKRAKSQLIDDTTRWSIKGIYDVLTPKIIMP